MWQPYRTDITALVKDGANSVELEYVTTLRNIVGPMHRIEGEPDEAWASAFSGNAGDAGYAGRMDKGPGWTNDYFLVNSGLEGKAVVEYVS